MTSYSEIVNFHKLIQYLRALSVQTHKGKSKDNFFLSKFKGWPVSGSVKITSYTEEKCLFRDNMSQAVSL